MVLTSPWYTTTPGARAALGLGECRGGSGADWQQVPRLFHTHLRSPKDVQLLGGGHHGAQAWQGWGIG